MHIKSDITDFISPTGSKTVICIQCRALTIIVKSNWLTYLLSASDLWLFVYSLCGLFCRWYNNVYYMIYQSIKSIVNPSYLHVQCRTTLMHYWHYTRHVASLMVLIVTSRKHYLANPVTIIFLWLCPMLSNNLQNLQGLAIGLLIIYFTRMIVTIL